MALGKTMSLLLCYRKRCSYSEAVESEVVFILRVLSINKLLPGVHRYLKVYLKPEKSAPAWCLSAGKQSISTLSSPTSFISGAHSNQ